MKYILFSGLAVFCLTACMKAASPGATGSEVASPSGFSMPSAALDTSKVLTRIGFGSCLREDRSMTIWNGIAAERPDLFVLLGDNVYGDHYRNHPEFTDPAMPKMVRSYTQLAGSRTFAAFRQHTPMMFTWDDHDFGVNDGGADYPFRQRAQELFLEAWDIPAGDERHSRPGIYTSRTFGPNGQSVQLILLDTRYFRGPLRKTDAHNARGRERYLPATDSGSTMLGEAQWQWLAEELAEPADLRIIVSSIQVIAEGHGWEAWRTLPHEREKLYQTIRDANVTNAVIVSGDRHAGAIYRRSDVAGYPLHELTTSSLNAPISAWLKPGDTYVEPGPHRLTSMRQEANFGLIDIDWERRQLTMRLVSPGHETWAETMHF
ncbi:MAG: alkaline phosphatase family protein [Hyphomonadaceae bacterium]|nr:alkaline phosphatase family protein [Hyphomonadaceae bacterium]MBC6412725.1 alkaline phosphatase family protein [Hyphomonadaceae bacterium]